VFDISVIDMGIWADKRAQDAKVAAWDMAAKSRRQFNPMSFGPMSFGT
jgi:hypothetical protein